MNEFLQQIVNGIAWGSIYALIALGYTMVYGVLRLINFAHGDVYMVGAMVAYYAARALVRARTSSAGARSSSLLALAMAACGAARGRHRAARLPPAAPRPGSPC